MIKVQMIEIRTREQQKINFTLKKKRYNVLHCAEGKHIQS